MVSKNEEKKSEREISEQEIDDALTKIMESEGIFDNPSHTIRFLAKILFNVRFDLNELKEELIKVFDNKTIEQQEYEELKFPEEMKKNIRRLHDAYIS